MYVVGGVAALPLLSFVVSPLLSRVYHESVEKTRTDLDLNCLLVRGVTKHIFSSHQTKPVDAQEQSGEARTTY